MKKHSNCCMRQFKRKPRAKAWLKSPNLEEREANQIVQFSSLLRVIMKAKVISLRVQDMYRRIYFEAIDCFIVSLKDRFDQPSFQVFAALEELLLPSSKMIALTKE